MKLRSKIGSLLFGVLLFLVGPVVVAPAAVAATDQAATIDQATAGAGPCRPGTPDIAAPTTTFYDPARPELGPQPLPADPPVGPLLVGYQRFGGLTEEQFVAKYRSGASWIYPPADGFLLVGGEPVRYKQKLTPGKRIDRFGYPGGSYLAPAKTLFLQRALPPQNLNTPTGTPQSNYHLYCVIRPFDVDAGPIAPWFEQLGLGLQYKLEAKYLPQSGGAISVTWLIQNGYVVEERPA